MILRISIIRGIGLLHDVNAAMHKLGRATLIFSANGRGKSTLAAIIRSSAANDPAILASRRTLDGTQAPEVLLLENDGTSRRFQDGQWSNPLPKAMVFDNHFVENNVYTGSRVDTNHRRNLLAFALGGTAVAARKAVDEAAEEVRKLAAEKRLVDEAIATHSGGLSLQAFRDLPVVANADDQLQALRGDLAASTSAGRIAVRPLPSPIQTPHLVIANLFKILRSELASVHSQAESKVHSHTATLPAGSEAWIGNGLAFQSGSQCPFCGCTIDSDLLAAYRTHFDAAYNSHKDAVGKLTNGIQQRCSDSIVESALQFTNSANSVIESWRDHISVPAATFESEVARSNLTLLRLHLLALAARKVTDPLRPVGDDADLRKATELWQRVSDAINTTNGEINDARAAIENFKNSITIAQPQAIQDRILKLEQSKRRHTPDVASLLSKSENIGTMHAAATKKKGEARAALDDEMSSILTTFGETINELLAKFGSQFSISNLGTNFRGGAMRTEYGLVVRGREVPLTGDTTSFSTTLSEGDKRTLAFAFFVAKALARQDIGETILVMDDPITSLDATRRQTTISTLAQLDKVARQTIVLSHDAFFLRDLAKRLKKLDSGRAVASLSLRSGPGNYSRVESCDFEEECASDFYLHHQLIAGYVNNGTGSPREVAKAVRPLLEGYVHRRFPGILRREQTFGAAIAQIDAVDAAPPLQWAKPLVGELKELNDYAGRFQHDTNPGNADTEPIDEGELRTYASRALKVLYSGAP